MASYVDACHAITPNQYKLIDLGQGYTGVEILAEAECALEVVTADQDAPQPWTQNPLPAAGSNNFVLGPRHVRAGDSWQKGFDPPPNTVLGQTGTVDPSERIRYIMVWGIGTGYLQIGTTRR